MTDDSRAFADLIAQVQAVEQGLAHPAVGDQQVDAPARQLAEVGFVGRRRFAGEQRRFTKVLAVQVTGGGADGQAAQVFQGAKGVRAGIGVEHHEFDLRQRLAGVEQRRVALIAVEDVQRTVGQPLVEHLQAAFPGQELPLHFDAQALEDNRRGFVIQSAGLAVFFVDVRCPGLGDDAQFFRPGGKAQASKKYSCQQLGNDGHRLRLRREVVK
ncbi:hypothetical protein D3C80_1303740 [compost metagenome]